MFKCPERTRERIAKLRATVTSIDYRDGLQRRLTEISRSRMSWCPLEYRDEYRRLTRSKMLLASEARRMIESLIVSDARAYHRTGQLQQTRRPA